VEDHACPNHKKTFSLETGEGISDPDFSISTFPVEVRDGEVYVHLPSPEELSQRLPDCKAPCASSETT
jgi:hypothetical protein